MFLMEAHHWSKRSHDAETQCGAVIVSKDYTILSTGYNGFIREVNDNILPNIRQPDINGISKYDFMIHAEHNAILNCVRQGKSPVGSTVYITGPPCNWCLQYMWQVSIRKIVYSDFSAPKMNDCEKYSIVRDMLLDLMNPREMWERITIVFKPSSSIV